MKQFFVVVVVVAASLFATYKAIESLPHVQVLYQDTNYVSDL